MKRSLVLIPIVGIFIGCSGGRQNGEELKRKSEELTTNSNVLQSNGRIKTLGIALDQYYRDNNYRYPTTEQGLHALIEKPTAMPIPSSWKGPYFNLKPGDLADAWGHEFMYQSPGQHNISSYDLYSKGPSASGDGLDHEGIANFTSEQPTALSSEAINYLQSKGALTDDHEELLNFLQSEKVKVR